MRLLPRRLAHGEEATLVEHLGELRSRLVVCLLTLGVTTGVTFGFHRTLLHWLNRPLPYVHDAKGHVVHDAFGHAVQVKPITIDVSEPFLTAFWVSLWAGLLLAFPVVLWQVWGFFAPAFQKHTQRKVAGFTALSGLLLAAGVLFGYFVVLGPAIHFLTGYDSTRFDIQIRARNYYSFVTLVMIAMAVVFELPIFVLALTRIGILPVEKLRRNRRIGYVAVAVLAVALPGIDPVTTTLEMIPLMILFEGSIWLSIFFDKRWKRRAAAQDAAWQQEYGDTLDFGDGIEADAI
jgi:sec-independent protein translocase protein TatC